MNLLRTFRIVSTLLVMGAMQLLGQQATSPTSTTSAATTKFEILLPTSVSSKPITGRIYVVITRHFEREPRAQIGSWRSHTPFFAVDVSQLAPGKSAIIDSETLGYPFKSLRQMEAGDYYVQALLNVYTEFHRSDGHTIWAHMDQWEGQQFNKSPGNLYSEVQKVRLDPKTGFDLKLSLTKVMPPVEVPKDTDRVKRIKIQSSLLSKFWGHPFYIGATVLLPEGYDAHPDVHYPVVYIQDHFNLRAPFDYRTDEQTADRFAAYASANGVTNYVTGYQFHEQWDSPGYPRMILVTFQHPTPFFDDSYAVNSANNGPYGDALVSELIPYVEEHYRIIRKPYARVLIGGSTGGWESLALQLYHPEFFGGTWTLFPDPIDFTRYQLVDIYKDDNAFLAPGYEPPIPERPLERTVDGQVDVTMREMSQFEAVLGTHGRSCEQLEAWEAVYGPVGEDGYPKPLWDKLTGKIDHSVADYMRDHGYDLRYYLEQNWTKLGPQLQDKLHIYVGDMDNYYLNLAVYRMEDFLKQTKNPHVEGTFGYGRPMKGHGWTPKSVPDLLRDMADHVAKHAPEGENTAAWHY